MAVGVSEGLLWTELCPPPNSHVEALTSSVTMFRDRTFKNVIKIR